jgi:hypothetical protein
MLIATELRRVAAELDGVARQAGLLSDKANAALAGSATNADRRMLAGLRRVSGSARRAQQAVSAAASAMHR